jgi:hypothetical protein
MKRRVFRIVFFSTIGVVFLLTLMGLIFQDRIINAAMDNIRRNIRSRITIGDASFSLIKDFPYASVRLYNVSILSTKDIARRDFRQIVKPDTLLKARTLNIKLNVIDLINAKITLKQIDIRDGELNILIDKKGNNNYQILKKSKDDEKTQVLLKINEIKIQRTKLRYINLNKQIALVNSINSLKSKGRFGLEDFDIKSKADVLVNQLAFGPISYVSNRQFELAGKIKSSSYKSFSFTDFILKYKNNTLNVDGGFSTENKLFVDASVIGTDLVLKEMNELIPKISDNLKKVNVEGKVNISAKARGFWDSRHSPFIYGEFDVKGGKSELLTDKSITSVNMKGTFSNGKGNTNKAFVNLDSFKIYTNFGDFEGKITLTNFNKPLISLSSNFNLFISQLNDAYHIDSTKQIDGTILGNITANGIVDFDSLSALKLIRLVSNGNFKLSEITFPINGNRYSISKGEISFIPTLTKANINFTSSSANGHIVASISNLYDGLLSEKPISAEITANTKEINFDNLLALNFKKRKDSKQKELNLVNLTLNVKSKSAILRGIKMENIEAMIQKEGPTIAFSQLKANAFGGKISMVGKIEPTPKKTIGVDMYAQVDSINIESLFSSFNNFGQKILTNNSIRGTASGDIAFRGQHFQGGVLDPKSIDCVANININNGQLIKFEPAYKLSKFIALKELENIRFSTIKNQITIKNGMINIPAMYIASSAVNLGLIGTHSFDGNYSYRVKLALKDVLFKKARSGLRRQVSQQEFENNMLLYFRIEGNSKTSKVSYDWNGKSWSLPEMGPANGTPKKANEAKPAAAVPSKSFKLQWDGEDVPAQHKPSAQPGATPIKSEKKEPKKEEKKPKFKVEWDE